MSASGDGAARELILLCRQLGAMLLAGTSILRALLIVRDQVRTPELQNALETAHNDMVLGWTLAHSLGRHPILFTPFFIDMIRQGEAEGNLGTVLQDLAETLEKQLRMDANLPGSTSERALSPSVGAAGSAVSPAAFYRLSAWMGGGLAISSVGWGYAAATGSAYAGAAATALCLGVCLAAWALAEQRRLAPERSAADPDYGATERFPRSPARPTPLPPATSPDRSPQNRADGGRPPSAPAGRPADTGSPTGGGSSGPPEPPIAGDRRAMPM